MSHWMMVVPTALVPILAIVAGEGTGSEQSDARYEKKLADVTTVGAIGTSLLLETSGFGTGLYRYIRLRLVDFATARRLIVITLPLGMLGALASAQAPVQALRLGYGVAMVGLAVLLIREAHPAETDAATTGTPRLAGVPNCGAAPGAAFGPTADTAHPPCPLGAARHVSAADGTTYAYCVHGLRGQQLLSGIGAFAAGVISTGVGEATLPGLFRRSHFPSRLRQRRRPSSSSAWRSPTWFSSRRTVASRPSIGTSSSGPCPDRFSVRSWGPGCKAR